MSACQCNSQNGVPQGLRAVTPREGLRESRKRGICTGLAHTGVGSPEAGPGEGVVFREESILDGQHVRLRGHLASVGPTGQTAA